MRNTSDLIEQHLKAILQQSPGGIIEIQRNELAEHFQCVPSQINYVISTRFTVEKGYIVESKRGGGGYIRIRKIGLTSHKAIHEQIIRLIGDGISQNAAEGIVERLYEEDLLTEREARIVKAVISRDSLPFKLPVRDEVRASMMKSILLALLS